jgi:Ca-activated chloride channel homolog
VKRIGCAALILIVGLSAFGQKPVPKPDDPYVLSVDVDLVLLNVTVMDKKGRIVRGLTEKNFKILEDGKTQDIREFHPEDIPATVGIVIDNSGSMLNKKQSVIDAASVFAAESNPQDELFIVNFSDSATMGLPSDMPFTSTYRQLRDALMMVTADGRTALYDGIAMALRHLEQGSRTKKALVVLSDGADNASHQSLEEVLRLAEKSSATIYTIGIYDLYNTDRNPKVLRQIAKVTGGEAYLLHNPAELEKIWQRIAGGIRTQYTIGYVSSNPVRDGTFRDVKAVVVDHNGKPLEVRMRKGYLAPQ